MSDTTTSYDWATAKEDAKGFVTSTQLETQVPEAIVFQSAILLLLKELGVSDLDRLAILQSCYDARMAEWRQGYETGKKLYGTVYHVRGGNDD